MRNVLIAMWVAAVGVSSADAAIKTKVVNYTYDGTNLKGFLAWDDAVEGKRPGVLVVHEFWGLNDYARKRAEELAKLGFVAFACDMYGDGKASDHPKEAAEFAGAVRKNLKTWQGRALAGLKVLQDNPMVDGSKLAAIGYCFGGSTALQLAYAGAPLKAAVTFHAGLPTPTAEESKAIKGKILICHGGADTFVPQDSIDKFRAALDAAKVSYQFISYPGVIHSFTVADADKLNMKGAKYDADADRQSWASMLTLFRAELGVPKK